MGDFKFAISMLKRNYKNCIFYVISIACSLAALLNMFVITFNDDFGANETSVYTYYSGLAAIILFITIIFIFLANMYFIANNSKELAIIIISGRSNVDIGKILGYQNVILTFIGSAIGIVLGMLFVPITNTIMYKSIRLPSVPFNIPSTTGIVTIILIFVLLAMAFLIDIGYVYQREVIELVKEKSTPYEKDKRFIKFSPILYIIAYIAIILIPILIPTNINNKFAIAQVMLLVSIAIIQGLVRFYIPKRILQLKENKYGFDSIKLISLSNLHYSLGKSALLIITLMVSIILLTTSIVMGKYESVTLTAACITFFLAIILLSIIVIYKVLIVVIERKHIFKQLVLLGYNKKQINKIIKLEVILFFGLIIVIPILPIGSLFAIAVYGNILDVKSCAMVIGSFISIYVVAAIISYVYYKKIISKFIEKF